MRNTRNWKNCTNWNKIKNCILIISVTFLHKLFNSFHIHWSVYFTAQSLLGFILHNYATKLRFHFKHVASCGQDGRVSPFGVAHTVLEQSSLLGVYTSTNRACVALDTNHLPIYRLGGHCHTLRDSSLCTLLWTSTISNTNWCSVQAVYLE